MGYPTISRGTSKRAGRDDDLRAGWRAETDGGIAQVERAGGHRDLPYELRRHSSPGNDQPSLLRAIATSPTCCGTCSTGESVMHRGLQVMAHRHLIPDTYRADITDRYWDDLDGTLPDPASLSDLSGGAGGEPS